MRLATLLLALLLGACSWSSHEAASGDDDDDDSAPPVVGLACEPSDVPEGGFRETETYLERPSEQCAGATCIVNHLQGNPQQHDPAMQDYVSPAELERRVHCTCKCDAEQQDTIDCPTCPTGFECCPNFQIGPPDIRGSYCVREGTCAEAAE